MERPRGPAPRREAVPVQLLGHLTPRHAAPGAQLAHGRQDAPLALVGLELLPGLGPDLWHATVPRLLREN